MRIKIIFNGSNKNFDDSIIGKINGFVNYCLGDNNEYHGKFSNYSVSSLQGGKMDKNGVLTFKDGAYLYISSLDAEFISKFMMKLLSSNQGIDDMTVKSFEIEKLIPHNNYDIIRTVSPILLTVSKDRNKRIVTIKDDDFNSKQRKILKDKFLYCDKFYYSRALNKETPFKLYDATYDDKIGLKLNNDSEY